MRNYAELKKFVPDGGLTVPIWQGSSWTLPQRGIEGRNNTHNNHRRSVSRFFNSSGVGIYQKRKSRCGAFYGLTTALDKIRHLRTFEMWVVGGCVGLCRAFGLQVKYVAIPKAKGTQAS